MAASKEGGPLPARHDDTAFWRPHVSSILERHGFAASGQEPIPGFNATYPTFVCGDVVVKLFGGIDLWSAAYEAERRTGEVLARHPEIRAPRLLAHGHFDGWHYLVTARIGGVASSRVDLSSEQRIALARGLGEQVRRLHALPTSGIARHEDWPPLEIGEAAARSSLPPHLAAQAAAYVAGIEPREHVFVHADLCAMHVFVENGALAGIIDWGDAMASDRHYELIQVYRDMLGCDKALFGAFLEASAWPIGPDFAHRTLAFALHRQAVGLTQHRSMDVFEPITAKLPLGEIATLDDLATELFAI